MITEFLIRMATGIVTGLFSLVPSWAPDTTAVTSAGTAAGLAGKANGYVPENLLLICVGIVLAVRLAFLVWAGVLFVYRLIPFNG